MKKEILCALYSDFPNDNILQNYNAIGKRKIEVNLKGYTKLQDNTEIWH